MKAGKKFMWIVWILTGFLFCNPLSYSYARSPALDPALEQIGQIGTIDWIGLKVTAKGIGTPPEKYFGKPKARPMAKRAAVTVARRNLLEVVKGIHIDSNTLVKNSMVQDDTIVARVQGVLKSSSVDGYKYLNDGSVEATVSMPFTGQLGEILIRMSARTKREPVGAIPLTKVEKRIRELENRVRALEEKLGGLKKITVEQEEMILIFKQFVTAWFDYAASSPVLVQAGYESDNKLTILNEKVKEQQTHIATLSTRLNDMAKRLSALEAPGAKPISKPLTEKPKTAIPYTGLVIDARGAGFRPCIKPQIFGNGKLIYPGKYVDLYKAIRGGYVRYYRKIGRAQQSARVGSLPYTITVKGTYNGNRNLEISTREYNTLKRYIDASAEFMTNCKVVIVF